MRLIDLDALPKGRVEWEDIFDAPIVDAVERELYEQCKFDKDIAEEQLKKIVRCKDCKYNGAWCDIQDIEWTEKGKPIEFCSYGERKEE